MTLAYPNAWYDNYCHVTNNNISTSYIQVESCEIWKSAHCTVLSIVQLIILNCWMLMCNHQHC